LETLFNTLQGKPSIKVILATQSEDSIASFLQQIARTTLTREEKLTWIDLTPTSQVKLLENTVDFQGSKIALIISADSSAANSLPLADLLGGKHFNIAEEQVSNSTSYGYNEKFYIDRTFNRQVTIKQDVFNDKKKKNFQTYFIHLWI
jgi:hypothetical protein